MTGLVRRRGWAWTIRHDRVIRAGYGLAGVFFGGALGILPGIVGGDWTRGQTWDQLWLMIVLFVLAGAAGAVAEISRRGRDRMIRENGTAYIVAEQARGWTDTQDNGFLADVRRQFARVVELPGPFAMTKWDWPLDDGAAEWEARAGELVRAFQVLNRDAHAEHGPGLAGAAQRPGAGTPNGVFLWAWWPVALAFGMRVTAAERGLILDSWQRPSFARSGDVTPETWAQRPHRFGSAGPSASSLASSSASAGLHLVEQEHTIELTVTRGGGHGPASAAGALPEAGDVSLLLIRFSANRWGPLPPVAEEIPEALAMRVRDYAGAVPAGTSRVSLHELRCVPGGGDLFAWEDYPALAFEAVAFVERKAKKPAGHTLLMGTVMPQEIGLGMGILAGQEAHRASWPGHLRPLAYDRIADVMVTPELELGTVAITGGA